MGMSDYNYLFGDTIMQRAVRIGKPVLYYSLQKYKAMICHHLRFWEKSPAEAALVHWRN